MGDQAFHSAERLGQSEDLHGFDEALHGCIPALELEAQHRAESVLLCDCDPMSGMGCEAWIVHGGYRRMLTEKGRNYSGCPLLALHPGK